MKCENCEKQIETPDEQFNHSGRVLCEDCYMDEISPPKACDPWAVYIAKSSIGSSGAPAELSDKQKEILSELGKTDAVEPSELCGLVGLKLPDLERELATLRHMEKIKGALRDGKKLVTLW